MTWTFVPAEVDPLPGGGSRASAADVKADFVGGARDFMKLDWSVAFEGCVNVVRVGCRARVAVAVARALFAGRVRGMYPGGLGFLETGRRAEDVEAEDDERVGG